MDTSFHIVKDLFLQIGLSNESPDIDSFIRENKGIPSSIPIWEADFWTQSQAAFLKESYDEDSDWVEAVDHLDSLLRD
ncbi:MAG: DUF2789 family protein [Gammaproteobacteria bacterium]